MSYFAKFEKLGGAIFRFDTRIYLTNDALDSGAGKCIAAVVGKNPGSASSTSFGVLSPLELFGDNMLPSVRNRFVEAYRRASKPVPLGAFVRIWNLFYLCDANLQNAIRSYESFLSPPACSSEGDDPPLVWFAWGGSHPTLDNLKKRFRDRSYPRSFFYDKKKERIVDRVPQAGDFPKHLQGLPEEPIVEFLSKNL